MRRSHRQKTHRNDGVTRLKQIVPRTYLVLPDSVWAKGALTNYFHIVEDCLVHILTYMDAHKLDKNGTVLYIDQRILNEKKVKLQGSIFLDLLQRFVRVTTRVTRVDPIEISDKSGNYSVLVDKLAMLTKGGVPLRNIVYKVRTGKRYVLNDREIIEGLREKFKDRYNIVAVDFDGKSLQEQIDTMKGCVLFMGCHGAGFTNAYFMSEGAHMLEFFPQSFYTDCFEVVCKRKKIGHHFLHGKSSRAPPITLNTYVSKKHTATYDTMEFRSLIRDVTFTMDCAEIIDKVGEILSFSRIEVK
jgi:capsular polysaccharide biosynthesis protein